MSNYDVPIGDIKDRTIQVTWPAEDGETQIVMRCFHLPSAKQFVAQINRQREISGSAFTTMETMPMNAVTLMRAPVDRYSARRLEIFLNTALDAINELCDQQQVDTPEYMLEENERRMGRV